MVAAADVTLVAVTVSFEQGTYAVAEGSDVPVKVTLSADPERTVIIPFSPSLLGGATDADYSVVLASDVTFNSGDMEQTITFTAASDSEDDDGESVKLTFGTLPTGVSAGTNIETTMLIGDDDGEGVNVPAIGQPRISRTAQVGQTLTADTSAIADANGIPEDVAYTYRWALQRRPHDLHRHRGGDRLHLHAPGGRQGQGDQGGG